MRHPRKFLWSVVIPFHQKLRSVPWQVSVNDNSFSTISMFAIAGLEIEAILPTSSYCFYREIWKQGCGLDMLLGLATIYEESQMMKHTLP